MSRRSYHAFIKAARKTGGLSLPAARKTYRIMTERLGAPAKGVNVKRNPTIFRQSAAQSVSAKEARAALRSTEGGSVQRSIARAKIKLLEAKKSADVGRISANKKSSKGGGGPGPSQPKGPARDVVIKTAQEFEEFLRQLDYFEDDDIEYASTAEYGGKK